MKLKIIFPFLFIYFFSFSIEEIKTFEDDFLIYNQELKAYVPLVEPISTQKSVSFFLGKSDLNELLEISAENDIRIFIENKFYKNVAKRDTFLILVSELTKSSEVFITIHSDKSLLNFNIIRFKSKNIATISNKIGFTFYEIRNLKQIATQKYILGLIFCILCFIFSKIFFPEVLVSLFSTNAANGSRLYNKTNVKIQVFQNEAIVQLFLVITLLVIGAFVFLDSNYLNYVQNPTLNAIFSLALFFIVLLVVKIILHIFFNTIFKTSNLSKMLILEYSYLIFVFVLILVPALFLVFSPYFNLNFLSNNTLFSIKILVFVLLLVREIFISYKIIGFRKKYLFAYICICDIFPFIYLLKITQDFSIL